MKDITFKEIINSDIEQEIDSIGFDKSYIFKAKEKFCYKNIKIFDLNIAQANILKQVALSLGCDCATNREVVTGNADKSTVILTGSISQLKKICEKLQKQPFNLKIISNKLETWINCELTPQKTKLVGILNLTQDSFSDGGEYLEYENAIAHLNQLIEDGADIIDIGAESTRPGATEVCADTQISRILPILDYISKNNIKIPTSIDTRSSEVANSCLLHGADIINDVSGLEYDKNMANVLAKFPHSGLIIQHSKGLPQNMQKNPTYSNLMDEIFLFLKNKIDIAQEKGVSKENIIIDPGIGFGKTRQDNFTILNRWKEFRTLGCPIMIGISRKSLLNMPEATNEEKDIYTLCLNSHLILDNVDYIRVHEIKRHKKFIETFV